MEKNEEQVNPEKIQATMDFRNKLVVYGKKLNYENPDKLSIDELKATAMAIFSKLNEIDMAMGYEYHDVGLKLPKTISLVRQLELFLEFVDWYNIVETQNSQMEAFVEKHFPLSKFKKIVCVGDGEHCHLGRKLAKKGYNVVSVDPEAKRDFTGKIGKGKLHVVKGEFHDNSVDIIDWADAIVGAKVPLCIEDLSQVSKPAAFSTSLNPEIYNMRFKGKSITSYEQYIEEIKKCKGIQFQKRTDDITQNDSYIFYHNGIQKERENR